MLLVGVLLVTVVLLSGGSVRSMDYGKVKGASKADGLHESLTLALMDYQVSGPVSIQVLSGMRTEAQQAALYAQGRTTPGAIVTYASSAADSAHGRGAAFDFGVLVNGVLVFESKYRPLYVSVASWFEARGFVCGVRWVKQFPPDGDMGHVEVSGWKSLPLRVS